MAQVRIPLSMPGFPAGGEFIIDGVKPICSTTEFNKLVGIGVKQIQSDCEHGNIEGAKRMSEGNNAKWRIPFLSAWKYYLGTGAIEFVQESFNEKSS